MGIGFWRTLKTKFGHADSHPDFQSITTVVHRATQIIFRSTRNRTGQLMARPHFSSFVVFRVKARDQPLTSPDFNVFA